MQSFESPKAVVIKGFKKVTVKLRAPVQCKNTAVVELSKKIVNLKKCLGEKDDGVINIKPVDSLIRKGWTQNLNLYGAKIDGGGVDNDYVNEIVIFTKSSSIHLLSFENCTEISFDK